MKVRTGAGFVAGAAAFSLAPGAEAATFEVDNTSNNGAQQLCTPGDPGPCSLSGALALSNASAAEDDTITFASSITGSTAFVAQGAPLGITDAVTISGPGPGLMSIRGNDSFTLLGINLVTPGESVKISGLTFRDGGTGGGDGAAIFNVDASLEVDNVFFDNNNSVMTGAALRVLADGAATVRNSTFTDNSGGIGGGILANASGDLTVINSTFSGNSTGVRTDGYAYIYSSTFSGNSTAVQGEALLANTVIGNNRIGPATPDVAGNFFTYHALVENKGAATFSSNFGSPPVLTGDPALGPLTSNGGPLPTFKPSATSPVVDAGRSILPTDQRGLPRPFDAPGFVNAGNGADLGSVELQAGDFPVVTPPGPTPTPPKCKKPKKKSKKSATAAAKKKPKKKRCGKRKPKKK